MKSLNGQLDSICCLYTACVPISSSSVCILEEEMGTQMVHISVDNRWNLIGHEEV